jgi:hypothetical protein
LSDTESERANPTRSEQKVYYSDTEMDPPSTKDTPPLRKLGNKIRLISGKIFGPSTKQVDSKLTNETCKNNDATLPTEPVKETKSESVKEEHSSMTSTDPATNTLPAKCSNVKWDGSRTTDTVKELLRMSHSGFSDQGILLLFYRDFVLASLLILFFS